jgi:hypothetical protein
MHWRDYEQFRQVNGLTPDELYMGVIHGPTAERFRSTYQTAQLRGSNTGRTRSLKVGGYCETGTTGMAGTDQGACEKREG